MSRDKDGFVPNPALAGLVGICPLIAASRSLAEGAVYGLGVAACALALGAAVPPLRSAVPDRLQAPSTLALSAAVALVYAACVKAYSPAIAAGLWIYLPLLAVSGLSLYALRLGSRPSPRSEDRLGVLALESLMFLLTAAAAGAFRELVGLGSLTLPTPGDSPLRLAAFAAPLLPILVSPAGGFMLFGFFVAAYRALASRRVGQ